MSSPMADLPRDLYWAVVTPLFAEYVLHAFEASYPRNNQLSGLQDPAKEILSLQIKGIFSLLHVSRQFRDITGRMLLKTVSAAHLKEEDAIDHTEAMSRLQRSVLLCLRISCNVDPDDILDNKSCEGIVSGCEGVELIRMPLVQAFGFINRVRAYLDHSINVSIREVLPDYPVHDVAITNHALRSLPSYYRGISWQACLLYREMLAVISFVDVIKLWCYGCFEAVNRDVNSGDMEERFSDFLTKIKERKEACHEFADRLGLAPSVVESLSIQATVPPHPEMTFKIQAACLRHVVPVNRDISETWMAQLAVRICSEFNCEYRAVGGARLLSSRIGLNDVI